MIIKRVEKKASRLDNIQDSNFHLPDYAEILLKFVLECVYWREEFKIPNKVQVQEIKSNIIMKTLVSLF